MTDRSLRNLFVLLCFVVVGMTACNSPGKGKDADRAAILVHPPYSLLTDSIGHHPGADQAGLYFRRAELLSHNDQHELAAEDYSKSWNLRPDEMTGARYASTLTIIGQVGKAIRFLQVCRQKFPANMPTCAAPALSYLRGNA